MRNRILLVFLAVTMVVSLGAFAACAKEEEAPLVEEEEVWQWPDRLLLPSTTTASSGYAAYVAWSTPLAEDTGMDLMVVCEPITTLRFRYVKEGHFFCTAPYGGGKPLLESDAGLATRDGGPWQLRVFYPASKVEYGFMVGRDSGLKTPHDIKPGTRFIYCAWLPETMAKIAYLALLDWAQVDEEDIEWVPAASQAALPTLLREGRGDVVWALHPSSPATYELEASPRGLAMIELDPVADPEGAKRFLEVYSAFAFGPITHGVPSCVGVKSLNAVASLLGPADRDSELIYHLVKWLDENHDKYKDAHPWAVYMTIDTLMLVAETDFVPLHDGTVRYLEEIGRWTPAHEARRQQNIELITRYVEAYQVTIDMADEKGISVDPENEEWLELWVNYRKQLPEFKLFLGLD